LPIVSCLSSESSEDLPRVAARCFRRVPRATTIKILAIIEMTARTGS